MAMNPASDGYSNTRAFEDLHIVVEGKSNSIFPEFIHDHLDNFVDILQRLGFRRTLGNRTESTQSGAVSVISAFIGFHNDFEGIRLHQN